VSVPAIAYTAQLTATRMADVLDADFITAARARGLPMGGSCTCFLTSARPSSSRRSATVYGFRSRAYRSSSSLPLVSELYEYFGYGLTRDVFDGLVAENRYVEMEGDRHVLLRPSRTDG
jgi:hypothetical protein